MRLGLFALHGVAVGTTYSVDKSCQCKHTGANEEHPSIRLDIAMHEITEPVKEAVVTMWLLQEVCYPSLSESVQ